MGRRVFFSFHYTRDIFRVNVIRNAWVVGGVETAGYWDSSIWGRAKLSGDRACEELIQEGLVGTSVTAVLIGKETAYRRWVRYEIEQSRRKGNGLLGIRIHKVRVPQPFAAALAIGTEAGRNPFEFYRLSGRSRDPAAHVQNVSRDSADPPLSTLVPIYDWVDHDGYKNIGKWVEAAATRGMTTKVS
jgi:hypothetical protein